MIITEVIYTSFNKINKDFKNGADKMVDQPIKYLPMPRDYIWIAVYHGSVINQSSVIAMHTNLPVDMGN